MLSKTEFVDKLQNHSLWIFVFQLGLLVGIEAVFIAVFTENKQFQTAYGFPELKVIGLATALYPIAAAIGALSVLYLIHLTSDIIILGASVFLWISGYLLGSLQLSMVALMIARIIKGLSIGLLTSVLPLYTQKAAKNRYQAAKLLTLLQAAIPLGILLMAIVAKLSTKLEFNIRWICTAAPALPIVLVIFSIPRPSRVIDQEKEKKHITHPEGLSAWEKTKEDFYQLFLTKNNIMRFIAASLTQSAGPLTAINVIFYYSAVMCQMLGFDPNEAEYMAIGLYACNFIGTAISLFFINRLHRLATVQYTILGLGVLHIGLFSLRLSQDYFPREQTLGILAIALLFIFVLLFSTMFAGISLVYTSEVVPVKTRGISIGLATAIGWLLNFIVTIASAAILPLIGSYIFLLFAILCCTMYCVYGVMPQAIHYVSPETP